MTAASVQALEARQLYFISWLNTTVAAIRRPMIGDGILAELRSGSELSPASNRPHILLNTVFDFLSFVKDDFSMVQVCIATTFLF